MAFEDIPGKSPESDLGGNKRKPTRLPIPIQAAELHMQESAHNATEKTDSTEKKKRKRRKKKATDAVSTVEAAPAEKQPQARTKRRESNVAPEAVDDSTETAGTHVETLEHGTDKFIVPEPGDEAEPIALEELHGSESLHADDDFNHIPLHEQEAAADLFISPRLHTESKDIQDDDTVAPASSRGRSAATSTVPPTVAAASVAAISHVPTTPNVPSNPNIAPPVVGANIPPLPPIPPGGPNALFGPTGGGYGGNIAPPAVANMAPATLPTSRPERMRTAERGWDAKSLWTGIIIGGVIEHVRHKRKQKKRDKVHDTQVKDLRKGHEATQEQLRQTEVKAERTKTSLEKQLDRLQQLAPIPVPISRPERPQMQQAVPKYEAPAPLPRQAQAERASANPLLAPVPANPEAKKPVSQNVPEQQNPDALPEIPKDHKIESSAWHHIEIDKRTGKAVETPTVAYGEEFKKEQHQEQLRRAIDEASISSDTVRQQYAAPLGSSVSNSVQHDDRSKSAPQQASQGKPAAILHQAKQTVQRAEPVDIALWVGLGIVMLAIIAVIF